MKLLYKVMIFFAIFQLMPLSINALGVFPEPTFYSDEDVEYEIDVSGHTLRLTPIEQIFSKMFLPRGNSYIETASLAAIMGLIVLGGSAIAIFTRNYLAIPVIIQGYMIVAMLSRSLEFFGKLFYNWDNLALIYLGVIFGFCLFLIIIITILESATHGDA